MNKPYSSGFKNWKLIGLIGVGLLLSVAIYWFITSGNSPNDKQLVNDSAKKLVVTIKPAANQTVPLADGASLEFPANAFEEATEVVVTPITNVAKYSLGNPLLGPVYDVDLDNTSLKLPVTVTFPIDESVTKELAVGGAQRIAVMSWNGSEWCSHLSTLAPDGKSVSAKVMHFSPVSIGVTTKFESGPARISFPASPRIAKRIPRGALVVCRQAFLDFQFPNVSVVEALREGVQVEVVGDDRIMLGSKDGSWGIGPVEVKHQVESSGLYSKNPSVVVQFPLYVPPGAKLGPRTVRFTSKNPKSDIAWEGKMRICHPLIFIVDIDGMRLPEFYSALSDTAYQCPNLRQMMGSPRTDNWGSNKIPALKWREFEHGFALEQAVTVFPTVTFAGHAAIFSGAGPQVFNMAGNEWFDRDLKYKYAFTGDNIGLGLGDSRNSFSYGFANKRLHEKGETTTVFQDAHDAPDLNATSYAAHIMYYGDGKTAALWNPQSLVNQGEYIPTWYTHRNDKEMVDRVEHFIKGYEQSNLTEKRFSAEEYDRLGIVTLYFSGLDHLSHDGEGVVDGINGKQARYLRGYENNFFLLPDYLEDNPGIDAMLGEFIGYLSDSTYKNATFIFTADHGQTNMIDHEGKPFDKYACFSVPRTMSSLHKFQDLLWELGYYPNGNYTFAPFDPIDVVKPVKPNTFPATQVGVPLNKVLPLSEVSAVVGLNGGMAHIYLRRLRIGQTLNRRARETPLKKKYEKFNAFAVPFEDWSIPPDFKTQTLAVAEYFYRELQAQPASRSQYPYYKSVDMVLVREVRQEKWQDANYRVYLGNNKTVSLEEYFASEPGRKFLEKNEWHDHARDAAFLIDSIRKLQSKMSGDLIIIPSYPKFYCEYKPLYGDHGSLNKSDFEIPFVVVRPGADKHDRAFLQKTIEKAIVISQGKNRPSNTDIKKTVLELLRPDARPLSTAPAKDDKPTKSANSGVFELARVSYRDPFKNAGKLMNRPGPNATAPTSSPFEFAYELKEQSGTVIKGKMTANFPTRLAFNHLIKASGRTTAAGLRSSAEFTVTLDTSATSKSTREYVTTIASISTDVPASLSRAIVKHNKGRIPGFRQEGSITQWKELPGTAINDWLQKLGSAADQSLPNLSQGYDISRAFREQSKVAANNKQKRILTLKLTSDSVVMPVSNVTIDGKRSPCVVVYMSGHSSQRIWAGPSLRLYYRLKE